MLKVDIFLAVWDLIVKDGIFRRYHVTVKVDPDTMFMPGRLRDQLYLNDVRGSMEVLSRKAV
eukprot:5008608-Heterocapsa_arctica.AAC.1